jgi:methylated-DNA-[protein]-cysteine S-methyltransferase
MPVDAETQGSSPGRVGRWRTIESPIGPLTLGGEDDVLTSLRMAEWAHEPAGVDAWVRDDEAFPQAVEQLDAYFAGERTEFDLALRLDGSAFERRVWDQLLAIPYGETLSYGEVARRLGQPTASRAVGLANGRNPIGIIVPCHRVIGADGTLTGYGGGLPSKRALLDLESARTVPRLF